MFNKKDQDLLVELIQNSRQSNRQLSKKIGYTKETIAYKILFLEKSGYLKAYSLNVDYTFFNLKEYNVFIKFQNFSESISQDFFDYLINHSNSTWVGKCFGSYDCKVSFLAKNDNSANIFIKQIYENFSYFIQKLDLLIVIDKYKSPADFFISTLFDKKIKFGLHDKNISQANLSLSNQDKEIIFLLGQNPKQSYVHIANTLNLTAENVSYKIKKFKENGVLLGTSIVVDGNKFNKIWGICLFSFKPNNIINFKEKIKSNHSITSYVECLGVWNITITFFASSLNSLYCEYNSIKSTFGKDILNSEFVFILDFYKYPRVPKCILE
jgi:DNA-binding Lrp family transcriptional regulator